VRASEEVALRRVDEKKRTSHRDERQNKDDPRKALKAARERADKAERDVAALEGEVSRLVATLDDPELYTRADGVQQAHKLGAELEKVRTKLDRALALWEKETASLESLERATPATK
jgi:DNA repair exonuclease SbcCD ATPase subunit